MRSKKSMYNLSAAVMLQLVSLAVGIILPRVMLVAFGSEVNGLVSSIKQFISYLTLVEAGLAGACIYSLYKPLAEKDYIKINGILSGTKKFYNKAGIIFSSLALVLAVIFPYIVESYLINQATIIILVIILGVNGALEFFSMGKYRALLTADQKSYIISIIQAVGQILNCIIITVMALNKYNIILVQLVATSSYIIRSILFSVYVKRRYRWVDFSIFPAKEGLHQRWDVLLHQIGSMIVFNSPVLLLTFFCTLVEVSIYTVYNMVFVGISGILGIFTSGLMAGIGEIISKKDIESLKRVYREYECGFYMIVTWIYSCSCILILPFMKIYTEGISDTNYINNTLALLFIVVGILNNLRIPQATIVNAAGHFKQTRYRSLIEVCINLVASIIFVKYFGMVGVLLGGICSHTFRTLDFIIYTPKHITQLSVRDTLVRILKGIILGITIIIPFNTIIHIQADNFIQWIMWGCIVATWSGIVVFVGNYVIERSTVQSLINRVFMVLGRKTRLG